jgi:hypothetical protein
MSSLNEYGIIPHNEQYKAVEPEPVAWMVYTQDGKSAYITDNPTDIAGDQRALPLYTNQPTTELIRLQEVSKLYEQLRQAIDGASESMTHEDAVKEVWSLRAEAEDFRSLLQEAVDAQDQTTLGVAWESPEAYKALVQKWSAVWRRARAALKEKTP